MRRLVLSLILLSLTVPPAFATGTRAPSPAQQAQQEKMRRCSASAKDQALRGEPRRGFMKECLGKRAAG